MIADYLISHYKEEEPIFTEDIHIEGMSPSNLSHQLALLTKRGLIASFGKGVYYLPGKSKYGLPSVLCPETIAESKYICRNGAVIGYYSGNTFANIIGISNQVPMKKEIVSNEVSAIVKEIVIGKQKFVLRKPRISVTGQNADILQFLDLMKDLDRYAEYGYAASRNTIQKYVVRKGFRKKDIDLYIRKYPDSTFRFYYEMRLDDVLA